jgi:hypothetical protein
VTTLYQPSDMLFACDRNEDAPLILAPCKTLSAFNASWTYLCSLRGGWFLPLPHVGAPSVLARNCMIYDCLSERWLVLTLAKLGSRRESRRSSRRF